MAQAKGGTLAKAQTLVKTPARAAIPSTGTATNPHAQPVATTTQIPNVPAIASTSAQKASDLGDTIAQLGTSINSTLDNFLGSYMDYANQGAAMANAVSRVAQERQFAYNSAEAAIQRAYNTEMWEKNASFNSAEAELTRAFNAAEAEKNRAYQTAEAQANREWQERMANTAYQREVEDLKAAGLNPVLAALNSGAAVGSGAQGSGSQASASAASNSYNGGSSASGSNYTGQGHNMSETLAMIGAIGSMIGSGASAFGSWLSNKTSTWENMWDAPTFLQNIGLLGKGQKIGGGTNSGGKGNRTYTLNNRR